MAAAGGGVLRSGEAVGAEACPSAAQAGARAAAVRGRRDAASAAGHGGPPRNGVRLPGGVRSSAPPLPCGRSGDREPRNDAHPHRPLYGLSLFPLSGGAGRRTARRRGRCGRAGQQPLLRRRRRRGAYDRRGTSAVRHPAYGRIYGQPRPCGQQSALARTLRRALRTAQLHLRHQRNPRAGGRAGEPDRHGAHGGRSGRGARGIAGLHRGLHPLGERIRTAGECRTAAAFCAATART